MTNSPQTQTPNRSTFWLIFGLILVLGAVLRLFALGRCALWIDEITVLGSADVERTPGQIISEIASARFKGATGQHMPFQYVWLNLFLHLYRGLGLTPNDFLLRLPFALLGVLSLPLFYGVVARAYNRRAGLWAMFLGAISFFHVYQSRDATSYGPLIFFLLLNLHGLVGLATRRKRKAVSSMAFLLGAAGALFTHLASVLFLFAEGVILALGAARIVLRRSGSATTNYFAPAAFFLLPMGLLVLAALPFTSFLLALTEYSGEKGGTAETFSLSLLLYQVAHFGWGRGGGRLVAFAAAAVYGLYAALRKADGRARGLGHLGLLLIPFFVFFLVLKRDFFPRYLVACFVPLLSFAAVGLESLVADVRARVPRPPNSGVWMTAVLAVVLSGWSVGPYRTLFGMRDKLMPMSRVREWLIQNLPPGGLYLVQNGYFMREISGAIPVPDRQAVFGDFPGADIPAEARTWRSQNARGVVARFPLAVLVRDAEYVDDFWRWIAGDFAKQESVGEDSLARLWAWGFSPHGVNLTHGTRFTMYWNPEPEAIRRIEAMGEIPVWPTGTNWQYVQTQQGHVFAAPRGPAALSIPRIAAAGGYRLEIRGVGVKAGRLAARAQQAGRPPQDGPAATFAESNSLQFEVGPFALEPGPATLTLTQFPSDPMALLVYSFRLVPVGPAGADQGSPVEGKN